MFNTFLFSSFSFFSYPFGLPMKNVTVFTISHDLINVFYPSSSVFIFIFWKLNFLRISRELNRIFLPQNLIRSVTLKFIFAYKLKDLYERSGVDFLITLYLSHRCHKMVADYWHSLNNNTLKSFKYLALIQI